MPVSAIFSKMSPMLLVALCGSLLLLFSLARANPTGGSIPFLQAPSFSVADVVAVGGADRSNLAAVGLDETRAALVDAINTHGILAIDGVAGLAEAKSRAADAFARCVGERGQELLRGAGRKGGEGTAPPLREVVLADGSRRVTAAAATVPGLSRAPLSAELATACPGAAEAMSRVRELVGEVNSRFLSALDALVEGSGGGGGGGGGDSDGDGSSFLALALRGAASASQLTHSPPTLTSLTQLSLVEEAPAARLRA